MQTNTITSPHYESMGIQNYNSKTNSNESLNQISHVSNVSNTQEEHTINTTFSNSADTHRSLFISVCEFFAQSSSASKQKVTTEELKFLEEGKSLVQKSDKLMQENQQHANSSYSSMPSCGWKTVFGLGLLAGASISGGAFLWARQQNNPLSGTCCPSNDSSPLSPYSMPLPPAAQSTNESWQFTPETVQFSEKAERLTSMMDTLKPIKSRRSNPKGDFFKQIKMCDNSTTYYKDCHVKYINTDNYHKYCFLYTKEKPCKKPENVDKPFVRVVEPKNSINPNELNVTRRVKNAQLAGCTKKNTLCVPYPLEKNPDTYILKCYSYRLNPSCSIKLKDYETE